MRRTHAVRSALSLLAPVGPQAHICAGTRPQLRRDSPTSAPGLAHICAGTAACSHGAVALAARRRGAIPRLCRHTAGTFCAVGGSWAATCCGGWRTEVGRCAYSEYRWAATCCDGRHTASSARSCASTATRTSRGKPRRRRAAPSRSRHDTRQAPLMSLSHGVPRGRAVNNEHGASSHADGHTCNSTLS